MSASGDLIDVFEISGRGVVVLLENFEGRALIGDRVLSGDLALEITGVERVRFSTLEAAEESERRRRVAFLVSGADKSEVAKSIGQRLEISSTR